MLAVYFPRCYVVVLAGRQPACVLRLASRKNILAIISPIFKLVDYSYEAFVEGGIL